MDSHPLQIQIPLVLFYAIFMKLSIRSPHDVGKSPAILPQLYFSLTLFKTRYNVQN